MIEWQDHITVNPKVLYGKPVITGTRVPVDLIIEKLAMGESFDYLLSSYPHIKMEQVLACLSYATYLIRNEESILTPA
ncbi:MAG: DUF433 domain-containing protein [Bacteroidota bacterium]